MREERDHAVRERMDTTDEKVEEMEEYDGHTRTI